MADVGLKPIAVDRPGGVWINSDVLGPGDPERVVTPRRVLAWFDFPKDVTRFRF